MKEISVKELKIIQTEILQFVHDFCVDNNIYYSLTYGTLIGAIRHKGFIPWDDDIDVCMPRPDYDKFLQLFSKEKSQYRVVSFENDANVPFPYAKVIDTNTLLIEFSNSKNEIGINIDIFPIDGIPVNSGILALQIFYRKLLDFKVVKISAKRKFFKNFVLLLGKIVLIVLSSKTIIKKMVKNAQSFPYEEADFITGISYGSNEDTPVPKSLFQDRELVDFEGRRFFVMSGYDAYLQSIYGDYMQFPPPDQCVSTHQFQAFIKR